MPYHFLPPEVRNGCFTVLVQEADLTRQADLIGREQSGQDPMGSKKSEADGGESILYFYSTTKNSPFLLLLPAGFELDQIERE